MGVFFCVGLCWVCFLVLWFVFLWFLRFLFSFLHWSSCRLTSVWFILSRSICLWTVFYPDWRCHTSKQKKSFQWQGCVTKKGTHWSSKVNFFFWGSPRGWFCHSNAPNTIATELAKSICGILLLHVCFCNYIILAQVHAVGVYQLLDNFVNLIVLIPFFHSLPVSTGTMQSVHLSCFRAPHDSSDVEILSGTQSLARSADLATFARKLKCTLPKSLHYEALKWKLACKWDRICMKEWEDKH